MTIKFRASSVGNLLVGGNTITDKQRERLQELLARQNDPEAKPLTFKMVSDLDDLIGKRDADFKFGETALSYILDCWLYHEHDYEEPVVTNEMLKGLISEGEALNVLTRQVPGPFRTKNEESFENDWFTGTPDVVLSDAVEDIKCSWTIKTFAHVQHPSALYYAQGQVYLDLTGRDTFRLCHVLVSTPPELVVRERERFYYQFSCDEDNPHCIECYNKVEAMHDISRIPERDRIKVFEFHREDMYLEKLRKRVEQARKVYATLTLKGE